MRRWVSILAITAAGMVTVGWGAAFMVRWLTSTSTTPETWVSWAVFGYLLVRAAALLDDTGVTDVTLPPPPGDNG